MKLKDEPKLHVKIISPAQTYYEGLAQSVSATNKIGPFDVLANHANFFSLLGAGDVVVNTGNGELKFPVTKGIIKASNNAVTLFIYMPDE